MKLKDLPECRFRGNTTMYQYVKDKCGENIPDNVDVSAFYEKCGAPIFEVEPIGNSDVYAGGVAACDLASDLVLCGNHHGKASPRLNQLVCARISKSGEGNIQECNVVQKFGCGNPKCSEITQS